MTSKLNKIRTFALLLIFAGVIIMYFSFIWPSLAPLFFTLGLVSLLASVAIYFWIGMLSISAVRVVCPKCEKMTKLLGSRDNCMYCKACLSLNPADNPK